MDKKWKIIIGSQNPAKVQAVQTVFGSLNHEFIQADVESGVSVQPFSDDETIEGAINRARSSLKLGEYDIGIGLEGGVVETAHGLMLCNWGALATNFGEVFISGGARIPLPTEVADKLLAGRELGPVMDEYTKKSNIRKKEGAIGVFTNERISRAEMFQHIMQMLIGQYERKLGIRSI